MKSAQELAALLGVNEATLRLWRAEAGIPAKARNVGYSEDEEARIREIAANKRKSKPRKKDMRAEVPLIRAESQKYADNGADSPDMYSAFDSAFSATTGTNSAYIDDIDAMRAHVTNSIQHEITSIVLERIESKIDALTALLERAAIVPRYVKRETVEDAIDERPKHAYIKHERPRRAEGHRLGYFCGLHGVPERTARDQVLKGCYEVTIVPINSHQEYYVQPEQARGIVEYWQRVHYPYTPCKGTAGDCCPKETAE